MYLALMRFLYICSSVFFTSLQFLLMPSKGLLVRTSTSQSGQYSWWCWYTHFRSSNYDITDTYVPTNFFCLIILNISAHNTKSIIVFFARREQNPFQNVACLHTFKSPDADKTKVWNVNRKLFGAHNRVDTAAHQFNSGRLHNGITESIRKENCTCNPIPDKDGLPKNKTGKGELEILTIRSG